MNSNQHWPTTLWITRHGQSAGNVARDAAENAGAEMIDIAERDVDVPLSALGMQQANALGRWVGDLPNDKKPNVILCSPYVRARSTAELMLASAGLTQNDVFFLVDERLREKEFGSLDRLTQYGIKQKFPELSQQRKHVGKFYFRPPGGESWCDVILRLRGVMSSIAIDYPEQHVMIVAHQVIVNCFRYLLEELSEAEILEIDRHGDVPNCGVTSYRFDASVGLKGKLVLEKANFVQALVEEGAPVTTQTDISGGAKA